MISPSFRAISITATLILLTACGATPASPPLPTSTSSSVSISTTVPAILNNSNCLQGTWHADKNAMMALMQSSISTLSPTVTQGSMTYVFGADNSFVQTINPTTVTIETPGTPPMMMEMSYRGSIRGQYTNNGTKYTFSNISGDGLQIDSVKINGQPFTTDVIPLDNDELFVTSSTEMTSACSGDVMTLTWAIEDRTASLTLRR